MGWFGVTLVKIGLKSPYRAEKSQKWYFGQKNSWSYRLITWYTYTTLDSTWPHLFLLLCNAKNATKKNGILIFKNLDLGSYIYEPLHVWYQCHQGNILRLSIQPYPFLCSCHNKKRAKNGTSPNYF